jgi:hypothetical protein
VVLFGFFIAHSVKGIISPRALGSGVIMIKKAKCVCLKNAVFVCLKHKKYFCEKDAERHECEQLVSFE